MKTHRWMPTLIFAVLALLTGAGAPGPVAAQGWIEPPPDRRGAFGVERVRTRVRVEVDGRTARVEVTEWFRNRGGRVAEGHYLYPLPGDAAFAGFSLFQGEEELRGEIMDAAEARAIYEEIVRRRKDPALIELAGHGLLRARVFPIEPGDTRKVTLRYAQLLERAGDALHFRYAAPRSGGPVAVTRPVPGPDPRIGPVPVEPAPDLRREPEVGAREHRSPPHPPLDFELRVPEGERFLDPFSPTHALDTERRQGGLVVRAAGALEGSLSVFLPLARSGVGLSTATHARPGEDGWVMLTLSPGRADAPPQPRDVTVVLDISGSMSGEKIRQARAALGQVLESLGPDDRFRLVAFSTAVRPFALEWRRAVDRHVDEARRWVHGLTADGGTNIGAALDEAFRLESPGERLPVVLFLTDGLPSVGERDPDRIAARAEGRRGRARVFAFGVGHDVNTALLDRLSAAARGSTSYVQPGESVERALSLLATRIRHPVLTDVRLARSPARIRELYPVEIPDVFAGDELILLARYERPDHDLEGEVVVEGLRAGRRERFSTRVAFPAASDANAFLPRLWASRKLGFLTRRTWTDGATSELVEEIRRLALRHGLPSPYTSYLVLEPGARHAAGGVANRQDVAAPEVRGAGAVRRSEEARRLREMSKAADLDAMADEMEASIPGEVGEAGARRTVAGRLFVEEDGVWKDAASDPDAKVLRIEPFSRAYFDLLRALPELQPYWSAFERVALALDGVVLELADDGRQTLAADEVDRLADGFRRGMSGAP